MADENPKSGRVEITVDVMVHTGDSITSIGNDLAAAIRKMHGVDAMAHGELITD